MLSGSSLLVATIAVAVAPAVIWGQSVLRPTPDRPVEIALVSGNHALATGADNTIALRLRPEPGWHTYWRYAGDVGSAPSVVWNVANGVHISALRWPTPELIVSPPLASYGYERMVHLPATLTVPANIAVGSSVRIGARVTWVACRVECIAGDVDLSLTLPVVAQARIDPDATRAIAVDERELPLRPPSWSFSATIDSGDVALVVSMPTEERKGWSFPRDSARVAFFIDSAGVIDHAAPQRVSPTATGLTLRIRRSDFASGQPAKVTGLLVVRDPAEAKEEAHGRRAIDVVAPVQSVSFNSLNTGQESVAAEWNWVGLFAAAGLALLGGTLLNLMPCVLPVLSMKVFGLWESASKDGGGQRRHVALFGVGVLVSMWALVATLLALRATGAEVGWGYQLQSPAVVGGLALLVFAAALNMVGVFHLPGIGGSVATTRRHPDVEAFLSGVFVTTLATPCSAPFLAAAIAYALTQGWLPAFTTFTALGVGLIWPLAAIASVPRLRARLPRPGPWMVTLQRILAFPLFATAAWLTWIVARQRGPDAVAALLLSFVILAFGLWMYGQFGTPVASNRSRWVGRASALAAFAICALLVASASSESDESKGSGVSNTTARESSIGTSTGLAWTAYHPDSLTALRSRGRLVLLDFTADWCLTCKVNERVAFSSSAVESAVRTHDVVLMRADWTKRDAQVSRALAAFKRNSVPLVVMYGSRDAEPRFLPTLLTPGILVRAIETAASPVAQSP